MTVYFINSRRGAGKTLFSTFHASYFHELHPNAKIYANYKLQIPNFNNFIYTPYGIIPYDKLKTEKEVCLIFDDIKALKNLTKFFEMVANMSRKNDFDIIFTGQYYTYLSREGRSLCDYELNIEKELDNDVLEIQLKIPNSDIVHSEFTIHHISNVFDHYDTNEIVHFPHDKNIVNEIIRLCDTVSDMESNLEIMFTQTKYNKLHKELIKLEKYQVNH